MGTKTNRRKHTKMSAKQFPLKDKNLYKENGIEVDHNQLHKITSTSGKKVFTLYSF